MTWQELLEEVSIALEDGHLSRDENVQVCVDGHVAEIEYLGTSFDTRGELMLLA